MRFLKSSGDFLSRHFVSGMNMWWGERAFAGTVRPPAFVADEEVLVVSPGTTGPRAYDHNSSSVEDLTAPLDQDFAELEKHGVGSDGILLVGKFESFERRVAKQTGGVVGGGATDEYEEDVRAFRPDRPRTGDRPDDDEEKRGGANVGLRSKTDEEHGILGATRNDLNAASAGTAGTAAKHVDWKFLGGILPASWFGEPAASTAAPTDLGSENTGSPYDLDAGVLYDVEQEVVPLVCSSEVGSSQQVVGAAKNPATTPARRSTPAHGFVRGSAAKSEQHNTTPRPASSVDVRTPSKTSRIDLSARMPAPPASTPKPARSAARSPRGVVLPSPSEQALKQREDSTPHKQYFRSRLAQTSRRSSPKRDVPESDTSLSPEKRRHRESSCSHEQWGTPFEERRSSPAPGAGEPPAVDGRANVVRRFLVEGGPATSLRTTLAPPAIP